jgi:hypothetical protein
MMSDRELLELAAKAAGYELTQWPDEDFLRAEVEPNWRPKWNPLADDGDALRLAVKLGMSVDVDEYETSTYAYAGPSPRVYAMEIWNGDTPASTRRAIVRAAAEIGRTPPPSV